MCQFKFKFKKKTMILENPGIKYKRRYSFEKWWMGQDSSNMSRQVETLYSPDQDTLHSFIKVRLWFRSLLASFLHNTVCALTLIIKLYCTVWHKNIRFISLPYKIFAYNVLKVNFQTHLLKEHIQKSMLNTVEMTNFICILP